MATPRQKLHDITVTQIRSMKASGMTNQEVADQLGISKALAHYYSKPDKDEKRCPRCCRKFEVKKPEKKVSAKA